MVFNFKRVIASRVMAFVIYSDNVNTFNCSLKWIGEINNDEKMQQYLISEQIK